MIKRLKELWEHLGRDRGRLKATVRVDFFPHKAARATVDWRDTAPSDRDTVSLAIFFYARLLYELAEQNETRVANELITFLTQVTDLVLVGEGPPHRPRLPLGGLHLQTEAQPDPPSRSYRADLFQFQDGQCRLDFSGTLGKEGVYLPATYVVFLQDCINSLEDKDLVRLARSLQRLHDYYKVRNDFWEGAALSGGPLFALSPARPTPDVVEGELEG